MDVILVSITRVRAIFSTDCNEYHFAICLSCPCEDSASISETNLASLAEDDILNCSS